MNKRWSKLKKSAVFRLLALMLCITCLCGAALPMGAAALTEENTPAVTEQAAETTAALETTEDEDAMSSEPASDPDAAAVSEPADDTETVSDAEPTVVSTGSTLYEKLMAAETAEEMMELLDAEETEPSFTEAQLAALTAKANAFASSDEKTALLATLSYLSTGENDVEVITGDEDASSYSSSVPVYWDTTNGTSGTGTSTTYSNYVTSVKLNSTAVVWGDSDATSWNGGTTLYTYYPNASKNNMTSTNLSITAASGYYVTEVIVACAPVPPSGTLSPYHCSTWEDGNNLVETYNLSDSEYDSSTGQYTMTVNVDSVHFSHNGATTPAAYFILIQVAKVPTPLFVQYEYGDISEYVEIDSSSAFNSPSTWTDANSGNSYGNGDIYTSGVMTDDTQFDYQYPTTDTTVIASWKHYANSISDAALAEAAAAGYYFTGWKVTWYNTCDVSTDNDSYNNDYTFSFSNVYMTSSSLLQPGAEVQLPTNVKLVAQWAPIELTVTKEVTIDGVATNLITSEYTMQVQSGTETKTNYKDSFTLKDGESNKLSAVPAGTYSVLETTPADTVTVNGTTYYFDKTTYSTDVTLDKNTHTGTITVTNNYTTTEPTKTLTITKTLSGNMYSENDTFTFTVTSDTASIASTDSKVDVATNGLSATITLKKDETATITIPNGATVTIEETKIEDSKGNVVTGYKASYYVGGSTTAETLTDNTLTLSNISADTKVTVINTKNVTIDTSVFLDTAPYMMLLVLVAGGAGAMVLRRKKFGKD